MSEVDELYVMARRVLLDALDALGSHRGAIVLVGAQAVYLRVGEADLAVAPFTTDGDLAIDPAVLAEIPPLEKALMEAGFYPKPRTPSASGSRNARRATRALDVRVAGLAALLVAKGPQDRRAARYRSPERQGRSTSFGCSEAPTPTTAAHEAPRRQPIRGSREDRPRAPGDAVRQARRHRRRDGDSLSWRSRQCRRDRRVVRGTGQSSLAPLGASRA